MWLRDIAMQRAAETPNRLSYRFVDASLNETLLLTYAELDARARSVAAALAEWTRPDARVVIALDSDSTFVLCMFGCLYAARVAVPAPAPRRSDDSWRRLLSIVRDSAPELVIVRSAQTSARLGCEPVARGCRIVTADELLTTHLGTFEPGARGSRLAVLQYTSGSTGDPKGVMLTDQALRANLEAIRISFGIDAESHGLSWLPMHHDMGLIGFVFASLYIGCTTTWLSPHDFVQRPARWLQAISRYGATISGAPAFGYRTCLDRIRDDQLAGIDLSSWQVALVGAERVTENLVRRFRERFAAYGLASGALRPCYGLAEATLLVTCSSVHESTNIKALAPTIDATATAGCGAVIPDHELICVDEHGRHCDDGVVGEVWVRGPSVAAGYYGHPEETARVFRATCNGRGPYLRTGDLGVVRDAQLFLVGRIKDVVVVRGRKFAPEDLESALALSHPALSDSVGVAFSSTHAEIESLIVVQELACRRLHTMDRIELQAAIREQLVTTHGINPAEILFVARGTIPRTTSGKVQRGRCRELFERGMFACLDETPAQTRAANIASAGIWTPGDV